MFVDPIPVAANGAVHNALNFALIQTDGYGSKRRDSVNNLDMMINHVRGNGKVPDRHYVQLSKTINATNPFTGLPQTQTISVSLAVTVPPFGFTETDVTNHIQSLLDTVADADFTQLGFIRFQS